MPEHTNNSTRRRDIGGPTGLLAHVVAAPKHPHLRHALRQHVLDLGFRQEDVESHLDAWTHDLVRLLAALVAAGIDLT